jgi:hypothetical protein
MNPEEGAGDAVPVECSAAGPIMPIFRSRYMQPPGLTRHLDGVVPIGATSLTPVSQREKMKMKKFLPT